MAVITEDPHDPTTFPSRRRFHLMPRTGPISGLALSADGAVAVTASDDGSAQLWDVATGERTMHLERGVPLTAVAIAQDRTCALVGSADGLACVWDLSNGSVARMLEAHAGRCARLLACARPPACVRAGRCCVALPCCVAASTFYMPAARGLPHYSSAAAGACCASVRAARDATAAVAWLCSCRVTCVLGHCRPTPAHRP